MYNITNRAGVPTVDTVHGSFGMTLGSVILTPGSFTLTPKIVRLPTPGSFWLTTV